MSSEFVAAVVKELSFITQENKNIRIKNDELTKAVKDMEIAVKKSKEMVRTLEKEAEKNKLDIEYQLKKRDEMRRRLYKFEKYASIYESTRDNISKNCYNKTKKCVSNYCPYHYTLCRFIHPEEIKDRPEISSSGYKDNDNPIFQRVVLQSNKHQQMHSGFSPPQNTPLDVPKIMVNSIPVDLPVEKTLAETFSKEDFIPIKK